MDAAAYDRLRVDADYSQTHGLRMDINPITLALTCILECWTQISCLVLQATWRDDCTR
jgi:hypothetical protein